MKKTSIIALVLVLAMVFAGCTSNELKLYNAVNKMQDVTSMESDISFSFTMTGEGFSEEEQKNLQQVTSMMNPLEINMHQKMVQNKEKTSARGAVDTNLSFSGMAMDMEVWVDTDMSGDKPKLIEIIKMPPLIMNSMYPEDNTKEYLVYDFYKMMGETQEQINVNEVFKFSKEMQSQIAKFIKDSQEKFNPGFEVAKYKEKRTVDGKELSIYEVKLDDAAFKNLVRYTVNYAIDSKDTIEFIEQYINLVSKIVDTNAKQEPQLNQEKVNLELDELKKELPSLKEKFNTFMDTFKDVKIIGDKGIVLEYGINSDGYIAHEAGSIPLEVNIKAIGKAMGEEEPASSGILKLDMSFSTKVYNINAPMQIDMPVVNESNSIDITDIMNKSMNTNTEVNMSTDMN
ncbi:hypothetical protein [Lutispora saccharofermentans]|uniref:Lipoprotein n=1 Tax=Lutispora saccharofermentans TaxID=3024236 RepID=A0ABT1NDW5_9FIRM|nr:hypothetical protein [Lutispora saccharofermentans]MCQ1529432.1 hypothetical protein [Lutispora saccharofermentans]